MWGRVVITGRKETSEWFNKKIYFYFQQKKKKTFLTRINYVQNEGLCRRRDKKKKREKKKNSRKTN
jgi:hypothetical protein